MTSCNFQNFDITVRGGAAPYSLTAQYRRQTAEGAFASDVFQEIWNSFVTKMEHTIFKADEELLVNAGSHLFRQVMQDDIRDLWIEARADLDQHRVFGLRLRLALHPPAVAALPWEALYDPDRNQAFAANGRTPVVRVENLHRFVGPPRPLQVTWPLKVLLAVPEDSGAKIDAECEIAGVTQVLDAFGSDRVQVATLSGRFSVIDLRREIDVRQPDLLHVITHGDSQGIQLWHRDRPVLVSSASLRATLERTPSVKLAFLNACLTGMSSDTRRFRNVASQMLQAGLPAVIAMQFEIRDDAAIEFAQFLYEELVSGICPGAIDAAIALARSSLYALNPGDFSYGTPVLWLNADDGRVFAPISDLPEPGTAYRHDDAGEYAPRIAPPVDIEVEQEWLPNLESGAEMSRLPRDLRFLARDWERGVQEIHSLLHQLRHLFDRGDVAAYDRKAAEYLEQKSKLVRLQHYVDELTTSQD
jgi:hypothetical protein